MITYNGKTWTPGPLDTYIPSLNPDIASRVRFARNAEDKDLRLFTTEVFFDLKTGTYGIDTFNLNSIEELTTVMRALDLIQTLGLKHWLEA